MKAEKQYQDIEYILGYSHGYPIYEVLTAEDQKALEDDGINPSEYIKEMIANYRDWQSDC